MASSGELPFHNHDSPAVRRVLLRKLARQALAIPPEEDISYIAYSVDSTGFGAVILLSLLPIIFFTTIFCALLPRSLAWDWRLYLLFPAFVLLPFIAWKWEQRGFNFHVTVVTPTTLYCFPLYNEVTSNLSKWTLHDVILMPTSEGLSRRHPKSGSIAVLSSPEVTERTPPLAQFIYDSKSLGPFGDLAPLSYALASLSAQALLLPSKIALARSWCSDPAVGTSTRFSTDPAIVKKNEDRKRKYRQNAPTWFLIGSGLTILIAWSFGLGNAAGFWITIVLGGFITIAFLALALVEYRNMCNFDNANESTITITPEGVEVTPATHGSPLFIPFRPNMIVTCSDRVEICYVGAPRERYNLGKLTSVDVLHFNILLQFNAWLVKEGGLVDATTIRDQFLAGDPFNATLVTAVRSCIHAHEVEVAQAAEGRRAILSQQETSLAMQGPSPEVQAASVQARTRYPFANYQYYLDEGERVLHVHHSQTPTVALRSWRGLIILVILVVGSLLYVDSSEEWMNIVGQIFIIGGAIFGAWWLFSALSDVVFELRTEVVVTEGKFLVRKLGNLYVTSRSNVESLHWSKYNSRSATYESVTITFKEKIIGSDFGTYGGLVLRRLPKKSPVLALIGAQGLVIDGATVREV